ncbi:gp45 sliding clamp, C terminal, partial [Moritella viscosa]
MILAVDMSNSTPVEHDGITYFVQLGKVKGTDEFHLYLDSDRVIITESDYEACAYS